MDQTTSLSDALKEAYPYAKNFTKILSELQYDCSEKQSHYQKIEELKDPHPLILKTIYIIWGICIGGTLLNSLIELNDGTASSYSSFFMVIFTIFFGLFIVVYVKKDRKEEFQRRIKRYNELEKSIPVLEAQLNSAADEAINLGYDFIPLDYFNPTAIEFFVSVVDRYLARDLHEAIVLYEQALMHDEDMRIQEEQHKALMGQLKLLDIHVMMNYNKH